jgi:hypothetical protein
VAKLGAADLSTHVERGSSGWEEWRSGGVVRLGPAGGAQLCRPPEVPMMQATDFAG